MEYNIKNQKHVGLIVPSNKQNFQKTFKQWIQLGFLFCTTKPTWLDVKNVSQEINEKKNLRFRCSAL